MKKIALMIMVQILKKILLIGIVVAGSITLSSCEKCKEIEIPKQENTEEDFYFVNYKVSGGLYFHIKSVSYNTESGTKSKYFKKAVKAFETQVGPVKRGFNATISYEKFMGESHENSASISVSKNNGPFAEKNSGRNGASYKINF